jgi:8-oxo-dGTP pyrophosphatase MutT (NUDIX family)
MDIKKDRSFGVIPVFSDAHGNFLFCLVMHADGHWGFPKGHVNDGESEKEAASRELREETGITDCDLSDQVFLETYTFEKESVRYQKVVTYFLGTAHSTGGEIPEEFGSEIMNVKWLPYPDAKTLITFPEGKAMFDQVIQYLKPDPPTSS